MNNHRLLLVLLAGAAGCATSPWPSYETAVRCHLDGKKAECDPHYRKAMAMDPKLQGIHASYGIHLLLQGRVQEADREFAAETLNYPTFATVAVARLKTPNPPTAIADATAAAPPALPPPPAAPPAGLIPASATTTGAHAATKAATKKDEGARK